MFFHGGGRGEGGSERLLLRSSPWPRALAELKLAPGEQSEAAEHESRRHHSPGVSTAGPAGVLGGGFQPGGVFVQCGGTHFTPLCHAPVGCLQIPQMNRRTLHPSVCLAADVSGVQQQQRLTVALLLLRLSAGARGTRPESRGRPALAL